MYTFKCKTVHSSYCECLFGVFFFSIILKKSFPLIIPMILKKKAFPQIEKNKTHVPYFEPMQPCVPLDFMIDDFYTCFKPIILVAESTSQATYWNAPSLRVFTPSRLT